MKKILALVLALIMAFTANVFVIASAADETDPTTQGEVAPAEETEEDVDYLAQIGEMILDSPAGMGTIYVKFALVIAKIALVFAKIANALGIIDADKMVFDFVKGLLQKGNEEPEAPVTEPTEPTETTVAPVLA